MSVVRELERLGGVADAPTLRRATSKARLRRAVEDGSVVRDSRGRYALPTALEGLRAANRLAAVLSHASAAAYWGWEMKWPPPSPTVTVPRNRNVSPERRNGVTVSWAHLPEADVVPPGVTRRLRTAVDCLRVLPFDEALAVADSALRHGHIDRDALLAACQDVRGHGRCQALRVAEAATERAANPFESVLRAIGLGVPGLLLAPQVVLRVDDVELRPDLVDSHRRLVVEAESFEWHGRRSQLDRDCRRYNRLVLAGWTVLRFSWEQVMLHPDDVRSCLAAAAALPPRPYGRANRRSGS